MQGQEHRKGKEKGWSYILLVCFKQHIAVTRAKAYIQMPGRLSELERHMRELQNHKPAPFLYQKGLISPQHLFHDLTRVMKVQRAATGATAERGGKRGHFKRKSMHCNTAMTTCF